MISSIAAGDIGLSKIATIATKTYLGNTTGGTASPTALSVATMRADLLPQSAMTLTIDTPTDREYVIEEYSPCAGTINKLVSDLTSGTCTIAIKINGTDVTSLSAVSATSSQLVSTATGAKTYALGDRITAVVSSSATPVKLAMTLLVSDT